MDSSPTGCGSEEPKDCSTPLPGHLRFSCLASPWTPLHGSPTPEALGDCSPCSPPCSPCSPDIRKSLPATVPETPEEASLPTLQPFSPPSYAPRPLPACSPEYYPPGRLPCATFSDPVPFSIDIPVKLFVGRFPKSLSDRELSEIFEKFGPVEECVILRDGDRESKGCAFVRFKHITAAVNAIAALNNQEVLCPNVGSMQVQFANGEVERLDLKSDQIEVPPVKIFVGSLTKTTTEKFLEKLFEKYGEVIEVFILSDAHGNPKGSGFVKMKNKKEANNAIIGLNEKFVFGPENRPIEVRIACSKLQKNRIISHPRRNETPAPGRYVGPAPEVVSAHLTASSGIYATPQSFFSDPYVRQGQGPPGANLFVAIPEHWNERELVHFFSPFGRVLSAVIVRCKKTALSKGFGFLSFDNTHAAAMAIAHTHGHVREGCRLRVEIRHGNCELVTPRGDDCKRIPNTPPTNASSPEPNRV